MNQENLNLILYNNNEISFKIKKDGRINITLLKTNNEGSLIKTINKKDISSYVDSVWSKIISDGINKKDFIESISNLQFANIPEGSLEINLFKPIDLSNEYTYLGVVTTEDLFGIGSNILDFLNPEGQNLNPETNYLKFKRSNDNKVLFVAQKPVKSHISWDSINDKGGVFGVNRIIKEQSYKIRLMTGGDKNPATWRGGEWEQLIVALHDYNPDIFNDSFFRTGNNRIEKASWVQETVSYTNYYLIRGSTDVSGFQYGVPNYKGSYCNWRPILEFLPSNQGYLWKSIINWYFRISMFL